MGVPALFRWLSRKYPKIVQPVQENEEDMREANPNGEENDMLYLDMNGIVHPCTHPENGQAPKTEEDMMLAIFKYTERVVRMVRPRKLLFMAIDGVAPRAKMNQQRSRRFRAAQEARTKEEERQEAILEWQSRGRPVSESLVNGDKAWDSNAITPGTPFMDLLAASLRYWVAQKMNTDPAWQHLHVIISDASVPGEGEHKIMDYIRRIRSAPEHDANTRHVVYGLDADLIMLSLATHEPYFKVLREDVFAQGNKPRGCHRCGQPGHHSSMCTAPPKPPEEPKDGDAVKPFIFLDVPTLREYLSHELALPHLPVPFDLERAIDDWVFLIFFVGNDFLPHLPSLEIREGAIDTLIGIWKTALGNNALDGWVTNHGAVELQRLQVVLSGLAEREDEIFRKRKEAEERQDRGEKRRRIAQGTNNRADVGDNTTQGHDFVAVHSKPAPPKSSVDTAATRTANLSAAEKLKREMMGDGGDDEVEAKEAEQPANATEEVAPEQASPSSSARGTKRKANDADVPESPDDANAVEQNEVEPTDGDGSSDAEEGPSVLGGLEADKVPGLGGKKPAPLKMLGDNVVEQDDSVKLWEPGYRERYYQQKFGRSLDDIEFRRSLVKSYVEGLCWVLGYYYQGCQSWQWYYPEHFSPFAADFIDVGDLDITFNIGKPFRPFEQLMGVFPADSRHHLPEPYHSLMTEPTSPIIDFYPEEFHIDMNGKKMLWQGVALLPFIDEKRLLSAMSPMTEQLTEDEARRNSPGKNHLFVHDANPLYEQVAKLYNGKPPAEPVPMDYRKSNRVLGLILPDPETVPSSTYFSPLTAVGQPDIDNDRSISAIWLFPPQRKPHKSVLLPGADQAGRILSRTDIEIVKRGGDPRHQSSRPDSFHASRRDIDGFGGRRGRGGGRGGGPVPRNDPYSGYDAGNSFQRNGGGGGRGGHNPAFNNYGYGGPQQQPATMPNYGYGGYGGYGGAQPAPIVSNPMMGYGNNQAFVPPGGFSNYGQYGGAPAAPAAMRGGRGRGGPPGNAFTNQQGMGLPPHLQYLNQQQGGQQHRRF